MVTSRQTRIEPRRHCGCFGRSTGYAKPSSGKACWSVNRGDKALRLVRRGQWKCRRRRDPSPYYNGGPQVGQPGPTSVDVLNVAPAYHTRKRQWLPRWPSAAPGAALVERATAQGVWLPDDGNLNGPSGRSTSRRCAATATTPSGARRLEPSSTGAGRWPSPPSTAVVGPEARRGSARWRPSAAAAVSAHRLHCRRRPGIFALGRLRASPAMG
jgi:hypothetical protein